MSRWINAELLKNNMEFVCMSIMAGIDPYDAPLKEIDSAPSIDICFCEKCMFADEEPIADGRYWCALHQCFMRFCSDGKEESGR